MSNYKSLNHYRNMWVFVLFDLPTEKSAERKAAQKFRKNLLHNGFWMFQYSIYNRHCSSREQAEAHIERVKLMLPKQGNIVIFMLTDKQFGMMTVFQGKKQVEKPKTIHQLTLF